MSEGVRLAGATARDYANWREAYGEYAASVDSPIDDTIAKRVWTWVLDPAHPLHAILVYDDDALVAFAHLRSFPRTLDGNEAGFLDDLWVAPSYRGSSVARSLFQEIERIARERLWTHVRWVAQIENVRARQLYEKIARDIGVVTYRMDTSVCR